MSEEPHPVSVSDYIRLLAQKDAEIERLKADRKLWDELMVSRAKYFDETVSTKK